MPRQVSGQGIYNVPTIDCNGAIPQLQDGGSMSIRGPLGPVQPSPRSLAQTRSRLLVGAARAPLAPVLPGEELDRRSASAIRGSAGEPNPGTAPMFRKRRIRTPIRCLVARSRVRDRADVPASRCSDPAATRPSTPSAAPSSRQGARPGDGLPPGAAALPLMQGWSADAGCPACGCPVLLGVQYCPPVLSEYCRQTPDFP